MNKLGARRLLKLAGILDKADALHKRNGEPGYMQEAYIHHDCGTPACAWGHYVMRSRPVMRRMGFRSAKDIGRFDFSSHLQSLPQIEFQISSDEDLELFGVAGCGGARTAKQAASYIRAFVKRKQAEAK